MKTVLFTDESRASPNDTDGLTKARFPLDEFVRATRSENKNSAT